MVTTQSQEHLRFRSSKAEWVQLSILLFADAVFYFLIIPTSIVDPTSFGVDKGLPPSFSPRLIASLVALIIIIRAGKLYFGKTSRELIDDDDAEAQVRIPVRALIGMAAGLLFAIVLIPLVGFYISGAALLVALLWVLGEKRPTRLVAFPACVVFLIWALFGQLLSLQLPAGMLFLD